MFCPYCKNKAVFVSSKEYYGQDYGTNLYVCHPCDARVGTHKNSKTPLGTMANAELREMRIRCHDVFDRLWKSRKMSRSGAYRWLQDMMQLTSQEAHIGMFNIEQCKTLLTLLKENRINEFKLKNKSRRNHTMNLKEMAAQILAEGFNPETDPVSDFDNLPDGEYDALLTDVQWRVNDKGTEWLSLNFEMLNEGYENRKFFGNIFFSSEKMLNQNIKRTFKYAALFGVELTPDDLDQPELTLVDAFKTAIGQQVTLTLKTSKSGFQNFELSEFVPF